jgi:triosephosphate isomerase (TIM)
MTDSGRRRIVAANWKMHGSMGMVREYVARLTPVTGVELVICPPAPYLCAVQTLLASQANYVAVGSQDVHEHANGAYTGEISAEMVAESGARWTIVGHSERRRYAGESDERIAAKIKAAIRAGLQPILCVGETIEERQSGAAKNVVDSQLKVIAARISKLDWRRLIVAYEPVWAIGTGHSASAEQIDEMHTFIRGCVQGQLGESMEMTVLYGGSVNELNADELFGSPQVDGALVGNAALLGDGFVKIARALQRAKS